MEGRAAARPDLIAASLMLAAPSLQWRAGQLPGLTRPAEPVSEQGVTPSMEGRAAARPDVAQAVAAALCSHDLQWRAGQLPGLTIVGVA